MAETMTCTPLYVKAGPTERTVSATIALAFTMGRLD